VQHLNETSGTHFDSTEYGNNGTPAGGVDQNAVGIVDGCDGFDGDGDYIDCGNDTSLLASTITISGWIKPSLTGDDWQRLLAKETTGNGAGGYGVYVHTDGDIYFALDGNALDGSQLVSADMWSQVVCTADGTNEKFYINGELIDTFSNGYLPGSSDTSLLIGSSPSVAGRDFNGNIDEVRISNPVRNASWIHTSYLNIADPFGFYRIGFEETSSLEDMVPPVITDVSVMFSDPLDPDIGWVNISCMVTDDVGVDRVQLNLTFPDAHAENISMIQSGDVFFYNVTLSDVGSYSYFIWANDTSDNQDVSSVDGFEMPPNWDINVDHQCSIVDLVFVAGHFDESGVIGWIREDVNNDGQVSIVDLVLVSGHFDETW
jgi:hypothetical protein